jgi:hypothetical protein
MLEEILNFIISLQKNTLTFLISIKDLLAIALSPIVAILVGEWLRTRNYKKRQRDNLLCRLLRYGYQLTNLHALSHEDILKALNEIKYQYSDNESIKKLLFTVMDKMKEDEDAQDQFVALIQKIGQEEGYNNLSRKDIERVFIMKK